MVVEVDDDICFFFTGHNDCDKENNDGDNNTMIMRASMHAAAGETARIGCNLGRVPQESIWSFQLFTVFIIATCKRNKTKKDVS